MQRRGNRTHVISSSITASPSRSITPQSNAFLGGFNFLLFFLPIFLHGLDDPCAK